VNCRRERQIAVIAPRLELRRIRIDASSFHEPFWHAQPCRHGCHQLSVELPFSATIPDDFPAFWTETYLGN
jgi:hypothetical protein